ncbi:MAG: hypothetical protein ACWGSQ_04815 [Longimicrobiales bacterium]
MASQNPDPDTLFEEANRLYWESEESVNQIGEALGLSKGVLYGLISPLPAGLPCPGCGEEMVFPNRTAREKGFLACPGCGMEEEEAAVQAYWEGEAEGDEGPAFGSPRALAQRASQAVHQVMDSGKDRVSNLTPQGRIIAGAALLGAAAGLALGAYLRRR